MSNEPTTEELARLDLAKHDSATEHAQPARAELHTGAEVNRPLTVGDVARWFGVTTARVHQLDDKLTPTRCGCGKRLYDPAIVERVAEERRVWREANPAPAPRWMRDLGLPADHFERKP